MSEQLPPDPFRSGDPAVDVVAEGAVVAGALDGLEAEPASLIPAAAALRADDARMAVIFLTLNGWYGRATGRRRWRRRLSRVLRALTPRRPRRGGDRA